MTKGEVGLLLLRIAAWGTIVIPILVDGVFFARGHMRNPRWLPHAKLHCAMSFFAAIALGASALLLLRPANRTELSLPIIAFLATVFWIGLILAGLIPGASWDFRGDPGMADVKTPKIFGVSADPNLILAILLTIAGWAGYWLARSAAS